METIEIFALVITAAIAIYGAGLSTFQEIRRRKLEKRQLSLFLEYVSWEERVRLVVVNSGYRPVTITSIGAVFYIKHEGGEQPDAVPAGAVFSAYEHKNELKDLPVVIRDGEQAIFGLSDNFRSAYYPGEERVEVTVSDAEGNDYKVDEIRVFDAKYGVYDKGQF